LETREITKKEESVRKRNNPPKSTMGMKETKKETERKAKNKKVKRGNKTRQPSHRQNREREEKKKEGKKGKRIQHSQINYCGPRGNKKMFF